MIINGKKLAGEVLKELKKEIKKKELKLKLAATLINQSGGLMEIFEVKKKTAERLGVWFYLF